MNLEWGATATVTGTTGDGGAIVTLGDGTAVTMIMMQMIAGAGDGTTTEAGETQIGDGTGATATTGMTTGIGDHTITAGETRTMSTTAGIIPKAQAGTTISSNSLAANVRS